jgi:hypothetical protein
MPLWSELCVCLCLCLWCIYRPQTRFLVPCNECSLAVVALQLQFSIPAFNGHTNQLASVKMSPVYNIGVVQDSEVEAPASDIVNVLDFVQLPATISHVRPWHG